MKVSVCVVAPERSEQLLALVVALRHSPRPPADLVVAVFGTRRINLPSASFPVKQVPLGDIGASLGKARNEAAARATGDLLVFLDGDMLPGPGLLGAYVAASNTGGVSLGEVSFLPRDALGQNSEDGRLDFARLARLGMLHPERPAPSPAELAACASKVAVPCRDYRAFHGDNFALAASAFAALGGFDERYRGRGVLDKDFARAAMSAGLPLAYAMGATAHRQHRPEMAPAVRMLDAILADAALFEQKWNRPVLLEELRALAAMGLIEHGEDGWYKLSDPDAHDIALAQSQADRPFATMAKAMALIESMRPARPNAPRAVA